jgi:hypothetical protein
MLSRHFSSSPKRSHALDEEVKRRLPNVVPTRWNSNSRLVQTVHEYQDPLVKFFQNIVDNPDDRDIETYRTTRGFLTCLQDFDVIFLLSVSNELFSTSDTLLEILQKKAMHTNYCLRKVTELKVLLITKRDSDKCWAQIIASH